MTTTTERGPFLTTEFHQPANHLNKTFLYNQGARFADNYHKLKRAIKNVLLNKYFSKEAGEERADEVLTQHNKYFRSLLWLGGKINTKEYHRVIIIIQFKVLFSQKKIYILWDIK